MLPFDLVHLTANLAANIYAALALCNTVRAYYAWHDNDHDEASQHGWEAIVHAIMAIVHSL